MEISGRQRSVFVRLVGMQMVSVCISLLIIGLLFGYLLHKYYYGVREWDLINQGNRMANLLRDDIIAGDIETARERIYTLAGSSDISLWVLDNYGRIVAGSQLAQEDTTLTMDPAETAYVLAGNNLTKKVMGPRYQNLLVVMPIINKEDRDEPTIAGALAMRAPLGDIGGTVNNVMQLILLAFLVAGAVVAILSFFMAKGFARPLERLKQATIDIAHGKYRQLEIPAHSNEVDHLVAAFNYTSEQIKETTRQQEKLERLRKEFLASLSHELRAPLTSLKGFLELMEMPLPEAQREEYRKIMLEDALYLERLVEDVQELSRIESGQFSLKREWVDLPKLMQATLERLKPQFAKRNIRAEVSAAKAFSRVFVDGHRIYQVFSNIILNAITYTKDQGKIDIGFSQDSQAIAVHIRDYGPGIPAEHLPFIWERFYKIDKARTRRYQGSGLGLAIVKEIVEAHDGTVGVESVEGEGTTFTIRLPKTPGGGNCDAVNEH